MDQKSGRSNATSALHGITQKIVTGPLLAQILAYSFFFWSLSARATRSLKEREQTRATKKRNEQNCEVEGLPGTAVVSRPSQARQADPTI